MKGQRALSLAAGYRSVVSSLAVPCHTAAAAADLAR